MNENIELILGNPNRAIRKLALPITLSMLLTAAYNLADSIWVSGLGADALAAMGFVTPLYMIVVGLGAGLGAGTNSVIARFIGERNKDFADNSAMHGVIISIIISLVFSLIFVTVLPDLLKLMGVGSALQPALDYSYIIFSFVVVFVFSSLATYIFQAEGDVKRALYVMFLTAVLNIGLDPIFIYALNMKIAGAAISSVLSAAISCLVFVYWLFVKKDTYLSLNFAKFNYSKDILVDILQVGIPASGENIVLAILNIVINFFLISASNNLAVGSYTAANRLIQIGMIPLLAIGAALITVGGVSYGEKNIEKLKESFNYSVKLGLAISIIAMIIFYIFNPQITMLFAYSASNLSIASKMQEMLPIIIFFIIAVNFGVMPAKLFQSVGKGLTSFVLMCIRTIILEVLFAYLFGFVLGFGEFGIYTGVVSGACAGGAISYIAAKYYLKKLSENVYKK